LEQRVTIFRLSHCVTVSQNLNHRGGYANRRVVSSIRAPGPTSAYINPLSPWSHARSSHLEPLFENYAFALVSSLGFSFSCSPRPGLRPSPILFVGSYSLCFVCFFTSHSCTCTFFSVSLFSHVYYFLFLGFRMEFAWIDVK
jgi:hypothetical protein